MSERLLRTEEVLNRIGFKKTWLYERLAAGEFPPPRRIGRNLVWPESVVQGYIATVTGGEAHQ